MFKFIENKTITKILFKSKEYCYSRGNECLIEIVAYEKFTQLQTLRPIGYCNFVINAAEIGWFSRGERQELI